MENMSGDDNDVFLLHNLFATGKQHQWIWQRLRQNQLYVERKHKQIHGDDTGEYDEHGIVPIWSEESRNLIREFQRTDIMKTKHFLTHRRKWRWIQYRITNKTVQAVKTKRRNLKQKLDRWALQKEYQKFLDADEYAKKMKHSKKMWGNDAQPKEKRKMRKMKN